MRSFVRDAPVSTPAEVLLGGLVLVAAVLLAGPWPLQRFPRSAAAVPVAVLVAWSGARMVPAGVAHWQPLLTGALVLATVGAALRRQVVLGLASLALLGATRDGSGVGAALALATIVVILAVRKPGLLVGRIVLGVGACGVLVVVAVLADEVVWAILLAAGMTAAACAYDRQLHA